MAQPSSGDENGVNGICLLAGALLAVFPWPGFTLSWTHSIEKTEWQEDYRVEDRYLQLVEARIETSGAGMEIPEGAVRLGKYYRYKPALPPLERLRLARSVYAGDYRICVDGACRPIDALLKNVAPEATLEIYPCHAQIKDLTRP